MITEIPEKTEAAPGGGMGGMEVYGWDGGHGMGGMNTVPSLSFSNLGEFIIGMRKDWVFQSNRVSSSVSTFTLLCTWGQNLIVYKATRLVINTKLYLYNHCSQTRCEEVFNI